MKRMNLCKSVFFMIISLILLSSCQTLPVETVAPVVETVSSGDAAMESFSDLMGAVEEAMISSSPTVRDIDDRDWLMTEVNKRADADQLMISLVYDALYYRGWDDETRRSFLVLVVGKRIQEDPEGALNALRSENLEELDYLLRQSRLLKESPWMVRDFFDEKSEFSYWYLLYIGRSFNKDWHKATVLPVMRSLIREDRITPASYIWLSKPESLGDMENEIRSAGYPWNRILHLLAMGRYIRTEVNRLFPAGTGDPRPEKMLF